MDTHGWSMDATHIHPDRPGSIHGSPYGQCLHSSIQRTTNVAHHPILQPHGLWSLSSHNALRWVDQASPVLWNRSELYRTEPVQVSLNRHKVPLLNMHLLTTFIRETVQNCMCYGQNDMLLQNLTCTTSVTISPVMDILFLLIYIMIVISVPVAHATHYCTYCAWYISLMTIELLSTSSMTDYYHRLYYKYLSSTTL